METLADLTKFSDPEKSADEVRFVARKAMPGMSVPNAHYKSLCTADLLGTSVPMKGSIVTSHGVSFPTSDGGHGIYYPVSAENEATMRWMNGVFLEEDKRFAEHWRKESEQINFNEMLKGTPKSPSIKTHADLVAVVDGYMNDERNFIPLIYAALDRFNIPPELCKRILGRYIVAGHNTFPSFAPYAAYCLRAYNLFILGMRHNLLSTKATNYIDLEYLYYLPFCHVFSSSDKFTKSMVPMLLSFQTFVDGAELKAELEELVAHRERNIHAEPGDASLIQRLWKKHVGKFVPQAQPSKPSPFLEPAEDVLKRIETEIEAAKRSIPPNRPFPH